MITPLEQNPYAPDPEHASSGLWVSGGGADGQVRDMVRWLLRRVDPTPPASVQLAPPTGGGRGFDMAELLSWAAAEAGGDIRLPQTAAQLLASCIRHRTVLRTPDDGRGFAGALLFGSGLVAVTVGIRDQVITYDQQAGVVMVAGSAWTWSQAARIPGARGYR